MASPGGALMGDDASARGRASIHAAARPAAFELRDVSVAYAEGVAALSDVSLTIAAGEKVALLGANGCGKSTLLRVLNGLMHPSRGSVEAFGEPLTEAALRDEAFSHRFRRRVGFIFQDSDAQLFSATVRDEIAFGPLQMGLAPGQVVRRVAEISDLMGIEPLLDRPPYRLSGGEKKKVAIASVLAVGPDVLLLDEPTNGLDPRSQRWLVELLVALHQAGKTLVTATHDLEIVPELADRAVVMGEDHCIVASGPSRDLLADHDLLLNANLIHEHSHWHGETRHSHVHYHADGHRHDHAE